MHNIQERGHGQTSHINVERSFQLAETVSGQFALDKLVTLVALCRGGEADISQFEEIEGNRPEGGDDRMSEEAGDEVEGEGEVASPDSRVRAGTRNRPTQQCGDGHEATHVPF